jgi:hypothetical protein
MSDIEEQIREVYNFDVSPVLSLESQSVSSDSIAWQRPLDPFI